MSKYGLPYMGSKGDLAETLCTFLPSSDNFYDLFGGGFAVTHCMLKNFKAKYKTLFFNEIVPGTVQLIQDAIAGKYSYDVFKPPFVTREEFFKNKDTCAYTRILWSFGNNQKDYLFGKDIESQKKSLHDAVVFNEFDDFARGAIGILKFSDSMPISNRRLFVRRAVVKKVGRLDLQRLEQLERLQQLQQLQRLQRLTFTSLSYEKVEIKPHSIIYCDPPYQGTADYTQDFDSKKFFDWAQNSNHPIFISEYRAPKNFDICFSFERRTKLSGVGSTDTHHEKLFVNQAGKELLIGISRKTFPNT